MAGTFYIVATPIGNLEDMSFRAVRTLREVNLILAEDTRVTGILLKHYDILNHILTYNQHSLRNNPYKYAEVIKILTDSGSVALVTDAGTPGISDPGNELIDFLLASLPDLKIVPIPGPSALAAALSVSGFDTSEFVFLGFFPRKKRTKLVGQLSGSKTAFAFYESPNRIVKTLEFLAGALESGRRVMVGRELTKMYETLYRGMLAEVTEMLKKEKVRGEVVVVVEKSVSPPGIEPGSRV
jgi:16S rRNA (cytidine1402-2'-O)-methyltransferase